MSIAIRAGSAFCSQLQIPRHTMWRGYYSFPQNSDTMLHPSDLEKYLGNCNLSIQDLQADRSVICILDADLIGSFCGRRGCRAKHRRRKEEPDWAVVCPDLATMPIACLELVATVSGMKFDIT